MTDYTDLKRLAEAFPPDLDWDSNTEPFFNGPSGESLGGGSTGFYCVYGPAFEIDDDQYDGPTYVETCKADFAKFMVAARKGVLDLITENEKLNAHVDEMVNLRKAHGFESWAAVLVENERLRKDAERYRFLRSDVTRGGSYDFCIVRKSWGNPALERILTLADADNELDVVIAQDADQ